MVEKKIKNIYLSQNKFFIASAHQSMFETFVFQAPLNFPIFILKKELLRIPLFGWYLRKIGSIEITRDTTTKENLNFFDKIKRVIHEKNRPLLIFPQGTRVKFKEVVPFKKGVARIYDALNFHCIPVAHNSGKIYLIIFSTKIWLPCVLSRFNNFFSNFFCRVKNLIKFISIFII